MTYLPAPSRPVLMRSSHPMAATQKDGRVKTFFLRNFRSASPPIAATQSGALHISPKTKP